MAGQGAAPFYSSWHGGGYAPATVLFYSPDPDTAEQTVWTDWWFEAATSTATAFPPVVSLASPTFMPQLIGR